MNRRRGKLDCTRRLFLAVTFLLYSFLPHQFALALLKDCGPHIVETCEEHENTHVIVIHEDGSARTLDTSNGLNNNDSSSHDSSHQIEEKVLWAVTTTSEISELSASVIMAVVSNYVLPQGNGYKHQHFSLDPPGESVNLSYLKTIRLLI